MFSIAGFVALRVGLDALVKRKISCPGRIHGEEWNFLSL
jgi:hypothetical protein